MKILVIDPFSYIHTDIMECLREKYEPENVDELRYLFKGKDVYENSEFAGLLEDRLKKKSYELVFSTNFYPIIATVCHDHGLPYAAWTYDTPMNVLPCDQMQYETNYIFLFDRIEVQRYKKMGYNRFWHMPLGVNTKKYERITPDKKYALDVTFMGKLYRSQLGVVKGGLSGELLDYVDKLVATQSRIIDKYLVDELISDPIIDAMNAQYDRGGYGLTINRQQLSYAVAEYVTYLDRVGILEMMGRRYDTHLFTYDIGDTEKELLKSVNIHGPLNYVDEMPVLFKSCKINLNWSLRAAQSAIPLRALDILGCGGFLLTNAQPEIVENFEDGREVVIFRSIEEAVDKAGYYLAHDEERVRIAAAGLERVKRDFGYKDRIEAIMRVINT